jgi:hypothetical protein
MKVSKSDTIRQGGDNMNKDLLRSVMVLHGDTNKTLATFLGISEQSVSNKINENGTEFKKGEIFKIKERYNLTCDQVDLIFFTD